MEALKIPDTIVYQGKTIMSLRASRKRAQQAQHVNAESGFEA